MAPKTTMDPKSASRIQSHADRTGGNQDFKSRAQSSAARNANTGAVPTASRNVGGTGGAPTGGKAPGKK